MKDDDFETDIIEVLKERDQTIANVLKDIDKRFISEIYLFFDYDGHAYKREQVDDIIKEMIENFNNETENGRIYISYPMVEAIKDLKKRDICSRRCSMPGKDNIRYKNLVAKETEFCDLTVINKYDWYLILENVIKKANCIVSSSFAIPIYNTYKETVNQATIFENQIRDFINTNQEIAVLAGVPFF